MSDNRLPLGGDWVYAQYWLERAQYAALRELRLMNELRRQLRPRPPDSGVAPAQEEPAES